jgi:uncharacterized protein (TIGR04255 family)
MKTRKLKNPPVKEVVFEIRFSYENTLSYRKLYSLFESKLSNEYPRIQETLEGRIDENIPVKNIVRDRFFSNNEEELINLGKDIISIHTLKYTRFSDFLPKINNVLRILKEFSADIKVDRIGLRYITHLRSTNPIPQLKNARFLKKSR